MGLGANKILNFIQKESKLVECQENSVNLKKRDRKEGSSYTRCQNEMA
jgi:hypothetical protein